jgi:hypothetical protein
MDDPKFKKFLTPLFVDDPRNSFSFGSIIGKANISGTLTTEAILQCKKCGIPLKDRSKPKDWEQELAFGDYSAGRYGWLLSDPEVFRDPIPAKGKLGFWEFDLPKTGWKDEGDESLWSPEDRYRMKY